MTDTTKQLYHFHVHKTGGVWFLTNVLAELGPKMRPHLNHSFNSSYIVGENILLPMDLYKDDYIVSSFRDPVKRTVSHFAWLITGDVPEFYKDPFNKDLGTYTDINVENLMEWVDIRKDYISNYQSKMFLYPLTHQRHGLAYADKLFNDFVPDRDKMFEQLNKVDFFYRTEQGTDSNKEEMKNIIWDEFQIPLEFRGSYPSSNAWDHAHQVSKDLYNSLSQNDKDKIASINELDSEIYETSSLFWKNGQV
jgi:hypothetical protein